ncbi:MAG: hypothetical protein CVV22_09390 [Ignavibacteriae bacterium HGW-Ignavibacteriae-1]|jgi:hypothetical protein|nr:MAG: hypothetical protein CVV22_09390 [Ignavibacteriae bacterium HGW-Ignavibacteriae-1]
MEKIDSLMSLEGRALLRSIYHELRYEKQSGSLAILLTLWKICVFERDMHKYIKREVQITYVLGFWRGTMLWMQEVVNRYFFSVINSFVYFGAAILLVLIGLRRFSDLLTDEMVIAGVIFEAGMLATMFIVMLFTPDDELEQYDNKGNNSDSEMLMDEVGEISVDFASAVVQLEEISETMKAFVANQGLILSRLESLNQSYADMSNPNPKMIGIMEKTNAELQNLQQNIETLNKAAEAIKRAEIEAAVRKELERILQSRI